MSMASMTTAFCSAPTLSLHLHNSTFNVAFWYSAPRMHCVAPCTFQQEPSKRLSYVHQPRGRDHKDMLKPISAVGSGLEASMEESAGLTLKFKDIDIAVESQDAEKIKLKVDLSGEETQKAFNVVLSNLARSAPPLPGFRRQKGGKTAKVPKNLLLDIIGRERVTNFVIREIVTSAVAGYMERENLTVKDNKINTTQSADELKQSFLPGSAFGFNVEVELGNEDTRTVASEAESESEAENETESATSEA